MKKQFNLIVFVLICLLIPLSILSENYEKFIYGKRFNKVRKQYEIIEIPKNWYCTRNNAKSLRYSRTKTTKNLNIYLDSLGFKGHIDKFIFLGKQHYEEDVFIIVKEEDVDFYRSYYYFDTNQKRCTLSKDKGEIDIACNVIDSLFN